MWKRAVDQSGDNARRSHADYAERGDTMDELTFGRWLNSRRRDLSLSRADFARVARLDDVFVVNELEHDRIDPRPLVEPIAMALGESTEAVRALASGFERHAAARAAARRETGGTMLAYRRARGGR